MIRPRRSPPTIRMLLLPLAAIFAAVSLASCAKDAGRPTIHLLVAAEHGAIFAEFVAPIADAVVVDVVDDPVLALEDGGGVRIALVATSSGDGSYRLERSGDGYVVRGDAPLGVQYGASHLLELFGFRFFHPFRTHVPDRLGTPVASAFGVDHTPDRAVRGIHMHILHPIEGFFDFWEPSAAHEERATQVVDWLVKNRGNYLQWPGLDDIQDDDVVRDAWALHTRAIIDAAHLRGVRVGMGLQLFGASNLQGAYDLVEEEDLDAGAAIAARLDRIADVPFDSVQLSFGEFLGADPATFVATLDTAVADIRARWPLADVSTVVHMGNYPNLDVTYMGETLNYYFLSKFAADPVVVPWVHSVMYYDLYEDAGGAYAYDEFTDHRAYLYERLLAGEPVVYFPETAYWIAFDNSIPTYLPLYVRSRWLDLDRSRADGASMGFTADFGHVLFSSGWEWGYWQNDWATLRASYELPSDYASLFETMFEPWGDAGAALATEIVALTEAQNDALIDARLAPYMASRDWTFEAGDAIGVYSQPRRPSFEAIAAMTPAERATFRTNVVDPLDAFADELTSRRDAIAAIGLPRADPFLDEVFDGVAVDVERVRFMHALLEATLAHAEGDASTAAARLDEATMIEGLAATIVDRRHGALHYPDPDTIRSTSRDNATSYNYGYLREAETRCFFDRERIQVSNLLGRPPEDEPFCALL